MKAQRENDLVKIKTGLRDGRCSEGQPGPPEVGIRKEQPSPDILEGAWPT